MRLPPRISQPSPLLPAAVHEVKVVPAARGATAIVSRVDHGPALQSIPLIGNPAECEARLREVLHEGQGLGAEAAATVARQLFAALRAAAPAPSVLHAGEGQETG